MVYVRGVAASTSKPSFDPTYALPVRFRPSALVPCRANLGVRDGGGRWSTSFQVELWTAGDLFVFSATLPDNDDETSFVTDAVKAGCCGVHLSGVMDQFRYRDSFKRPFNTDRDGLELRGQIGGTQVLFDIFQVGAYFGVIDQQAELQSEANREYDGTVTLAVLYRPPFLPGELPWSTSLLATRAWINYREPDPTIDPEVDFRLLSDGRDLVRLRDGARRLFELAQHPAIATMTEHVWVGKTGQGMMDFRDDAQIDAWLLAECLDYVHAGGTCRMGPLEEPHAVVDPEGRVRGVEGLWVVDASIMPRIPRSGGCHATVLMIGERAVEFIEAALRHPPGV